MQDDLSAEFGPSQLGVLPFAVTAEVGLAKGDHFEQTERARSFQGIEMSARNVMAHQNNNRNHRSPAHHDDADSLDNHLHYENKAVARTGYASDYALSHPVMAPVRARCGCGDCCQCLEAASERLFLLR